MNDTNLLIETSVNDGSVWTQNSYGYWRRNIKGKNTTLHRLTWEFFHGDIPKGYVIDHIDRNKSNNLISNLRLVTSQQNALNKLGTLGSSKYKGVLKLKEDSWLCQLNLRGNGNNFRYTRTFPAEILAARDYDRVLLNEVPEEITKEHDLPGNIPGRFIPKLNFEYIDLPPLHSARLISITETLPAIKEELGVDSPEGLVAYAARVSNIQNQDNKNIEKLIKYCCDHGHWSILETVVCTIEITTTKDIASQIIRHKSFNFQEMSYRYTDSTFLTQPYEIPELRKQDTKNKQNSIVTSEFSDLNDSVKRELEKVYSLYLQLLERGVAKECARRILPVSYTTRLYMTGNIRSWVFYIKARNSRDGKAQKEHQMVADSIEQIFSEQFPIVYKSLFA